MTATYTTEHLYEQLPAIYRLRDAEQGYPLRSVLAIIAREVGIVEKDIARLYANWFIETSDEWVVPYIGDLLGVRGLHALADTGFTRRAFVANALSYRRRKGTTTMLEQLARDTTLWNARVVEFFELLGTTQYINHLRPHNVRTPDLRQTNALELLDTPFDKIGHTADVRRIAAGRGKHNIPNIGIFLWRLQAYYVTRCTPQQVAGPADGRYTFSPLGNDAPLFNRPQTETTISHSADEINVPGRLRRHTLYDDLEGYRRVLTSGKGRLATGYLDPRQPVLQVYFDQPCAAANPDVDCLPLRPEEIIVCDLSNWTAPGWSSPESETLARKIIKPGDTATFVTKVAVDPVLGRLAVLKNLSSPPAKVEVCYAYGFSGDLGGGPYDRRFVPKADDPVPSAYENTVAAPADLGVMYRVSVSGFKALTLAVAQWVLDGRPHAVIQIDDSRTYQETLTISMAATDLVIQAANRQRPTLTGNIRSTGNRQGRLALNGLLISGNITVDDDSVRQLDVLHSTLVPGASLAAEEKLLQPVSPSITTNQSNSSLTVNMVRSIAGPLRLPENMVALLARDCIIESPLRDHSDEPAIGGDHTGTLPGPTTILERVTVLGKVHVKELTLASEVIFSGRVQAVRRQAGCVRFSYVPPDSQTPRRFRCQPELAITSAVEQAQEQAGSTLAPAVAEAIRKQIVGRLLPNFTSTRYGEPAYGQLSLTCPAEIRTGAGDSSEMGAFSFLKQPQRTANLQSNLEEYLRFGLEAGIFFVT